MNREMKDRMQINKIGKWILFLLPFFLFSCTDDSNSNGGGNSDETATLRLTVHPSDATQVTRTSLSTESKVSNLHILVFNSSGELVSSKYSDTADTVVNVATRQGTNYTIYAVANTDNSAFFQGIATLTQFKKMLTTLDANTYPLMCGCLTGQSVNQSDVAIEGLKLTRLFAKVTLNVTAATGITITSYQFCNVATSVYLDRDTVAGITWANKTAVAASSISGVTCYMYGNPQGTVTHTDQTYKVQGAPSNASYVLVTATQSNVTATYKIYLGSDNASDYNVYRNYSYTYNITLTSLYTADTRVTIGSSATTQTSSNCYILNPGGNSIGILVSRANADGTTRLSSTTTGWTCGLLWTDNSNGLSSSSAIASIVADAANGQVIVTSGRAEGNAVIYVKDSSGNIAWSWHIWVTSYNPNASTNGTTYTYTATDGTSSSTNTFMDRNLGAKNATQGDVGTFGFYYQWGRKDPFPGPASWSASNSYNSQPIYNETGNQLTELADNTGTGVIRESVTSAYSNYLSMSIQHPLTYYTGTDWYSTSIHADLWGGIASGTSTTKTVYDPCPFGWKVPSVNSSLSPLYGLSFTLNNNGYYNASVGYWPSIDCRDPNSAIIHPSLGSITYNWLASYNSVTTGIFWCEASSNNTLSDVSRAYGAPVRCVKE